MAIIQPISSPTFAISGTTPLVDNVILRRESATPDGSIAIFIASLTESKLYSGSPIPIKTILLNFLDWPTKLFVAVGHSPKSCLAIKT